MLRFIVLIVFTLFPIVAIAQASERTIAVDHPGKMVLIRIASGNGEIERVFMPVPNGQDAVSVTNNFTLSGLPVPQMLPLDVSTIVSALDDPTTALVIGAFDTNNPVLDPVFESDVAVYVFENEYALQPTMLTRGSQAITSGSTVVPVEGPNQTILVLNGSIDQPIRTILYPSNTSATGLNDWLGPAGLSTVPLLIYDNQTASRLGEPQIGLLTGSSTFANPANDNILQTSALTQVYTVQVSAFLLDVTPEKPATVVTSQAPEVVPLPVPTPPPVAQEELVVVPDPVPTPTTPVERAPEIEPQQVEPEQVTVADASVAAKAGSDDYIVHADFGVTVFVSHEIECSKPTFRILTNNAAFLSAVERNRTRQFFDAALKPVHRYCEHRPDEYVPFDANVFLDDVQIAELSGTHSFLMQNGDPVDVSVTAPPEITDQQIYETYWSQYPNTQLDEETLKTLSDQGVADASFALAVSYKTADYSQQTYFAVPGLFSALEIDDVYFERAIEQGFPTAPHFRFLSILDRATADQRSNPSSLRTNERDQLVLSIAQSVQRGTLDGELTRRYADSRGLPIDDILAKLQSPDPGDADIVIAMNDFADNDPSQATSGMSINHEGDTVNIDFSRNTIVDISTGMMIYVADGFFCESPVFAVDVAHASMVERLVYDPNPIDGFLKNAWFNLSGTLCPQYSYDEEPQKGRVFIYDPDGLAGEVSYVFTYGGLMTGRDDKMQVFGHDMRAPQTTDPAPAYIADYLQNGRINVRNDEILGSMLVDTSGEGNYLVGQLTPERWPEHAPAKASAITQGYPLALIERAETWLDQNGVSQQVRRGLQPPELTLAQIADMTVLVEDAVATRYVIAIPLARMAAIAGAQLGSIDDIYERRGVTQFGYSQPKPQAGLPPTHRQLRTALTREMITSRCNWISLFFDKYAQRQQSAPIFGVFLEDLKPLNNVCHVDALDTLGYQQFIGIKQVMNETCGLDETGTRGLCSFNFTFHCETDYVEGMQQLFDTCTFLRLSVAEGTAAVQLNGEQWDILEVVPEKLDVDEIWDSVTQQ